MKTPRMILDEVRDLFATTHWIQGTMRREDPDKNRYCLIGGARTCAGFRPFEEISEEYATFGSHPALRAYADLLRPLAIHASERLADLDLEPDLAENVAIWSATLATPANKLTVARLRDLENLAIVYNDHCSGVQDVLSLIDESLPELVTA